MTRSTLDSLFPGQGCVLLDGATGTALRAHGWPAARPTVLANLDAPGLVAEVHGGHRSAGARLLTTNTFGALLLSDGRCLEAVAAGARLARTAARGARVAGSVAAFGLAVDDPQLEAVVRALVDEGVDLLVFETCNHVRDALAALELRDRVAARLPLVISASTTDGSREDRERVRDVIAVVQAGADDGVEMGLNCCRGPHDALRLALAAAPVVRWVKPSTGPPADRVGPDVMAAFARASRNGRVRFIGGCCGTGADELEAMAAALRTEGP